MIMNDKAKLFERFVLFVVVEQLSTFATLYAFEREFGILGYLNRGQVSISLNFKRRLFQKARPFYNLRKIRRYNFLL